MTNSWNNFLLSTALSYVVPPQTSLSTSTTKDNSTTSSQSSVSNASSQSCPDYWHVELLQKIQNIYPSTNNDISNNKNDGVSSINYGSYILIATYLAERLVHRLSLQLTSQHHPDIDEEDNVQEQDMRIGVAIPEGPFLPLYILTIHAINVAISQYNWQICSTFSHKEQSTKVKSAVLIPLDANEAQERFRHMILDSKPNLILVASGKDMDNVRSIILNSSKKNEDSEMLDVELADFAMLLEEALSTLQLHLQSGNNNGIDSIVDKLWSSEVRRNECLVQYPHCTSSCYDVARLVALGLVRLITSSIGGETSSASSNTSHSSSQSTPREIMSSHIVYTSGTTGKPKGCISSLASLQHYIRSKNIAHDINNKSNVLLASAITFDPCLSDILATCAVNCTLCLASRDLLYSRSDELSNENESCYRGLTKLLRQMNITHVLCTPTLWATVEGSPLKNSIPSLQVIALGGEPIPKTMVKVWSRTKSKGQNNVEEYNRRFPRLCSTYGVTEACVYQTFGEIVLSDDCSNDISKSGQSVGLPLLGTNIHICHPNSEEIDQVNTTILRQVEQNVNSSEPVIGEVVISGEQVDEMSSYLNLPELTSRVFVVQSHNGEETRHFYRTGDLGYISQSTGNLHILGRIKGDGMVKINGIRIELAEIENSVIDDGALASDEEGSLVVDCLANMSISTDDKSDEEYEHKQLIAYCVLSTAAISQLDIPLGDLKRGMIVSPSPLLSVLRTRCNRRVRKGCTPSFFVIVDRFPLSPTGKRNRSALPTLGDCSIMGGESHGSSLWECGKVGTIVANKICACLNLQSCQRQLVTLDANFFTLGGDSLAATRLVRGLYAEHHGILNSRNLGGSTGVLDGPFSARYLLEADTLGVYVKYLESKSVFQIDKDSDGDGVSKAEDIHSDTATNPNEKKQSTDPLIEHLIEAITLGQTSVVSSLLDLGVDPNSMEHKGRLGKVRDRNKQRATFKSNPLHLACLRGNPYLVKKLLSCGCKANSPDATGSFPIHLACSRIDDSSVDTREEDFNRLQCVKLLLDSGKTPISIKDVNKQTILHSAARSGHEELLKHIMIQWRIVSESTGMSFKSHSNIPGRIYDWQDRWFRTVRIFYMLS